MTVLAGLFLIAHGLVHLALWLPPPPPDAPFDSRHSWLFGEFAVQSRVLAIVACALLVVAGVLVLVQAGLAAAVAVAGATPPAGGVVARRLRHLDPLLGTGPA